MVSLDGKSIQDAMTLIRGPLGVTVSLHIQRTSESLVVPVAREEVVIGK
jgi:hypothetical protein